MFAFAFGLGAVGVDSVDSTCVAVVVAVVDQLLHLDFHFELEQQPMKYIIKFDSYGKSKMTYEKGTHKGKSKCRI